MVFKTNQRVETLLEARLALLIVRLQAMQTSINNAIEEAQSILKNGLPLAINEEALIDIITGLVCDHFSVCIEDIRKKDRRLKFIEPRYTLAILLKVYLNLSPTIIGSHIYHDHSTVHHAFKKMQNAKDTNDILYRQYLHVEKQLLNVLEQMGLPAIQKPLPLELTA